MKKSTNRKEIIEIIIRLIVILIIALFHMPIFADMFYTNYTEQNIENSSKYFAVFLGQFIALYLYFIGLNFFVKMITTGLILEDYSKEKI